MKKDRLLKITATSMAAFMVLDILASTDVYAVSFNEINEDVMVETAAPEAGAVGLDAIDEILSEEEASDKTSEIPQDNYVEGVLMVVLEDDYEGKCLDVIDKIEEQTEVEENRIAELTVSDNTIADVSAQTEAIEDLETAKDVAREIVDKAEGQGDEGLTFALADVPEDMSMEEAMLMYASIPGVKSVSADQYLENESTNDPSYSSQWYFNNMGAEDAWTYMDIAGAGTVTVGVLDEGVDTTHADLAANIDTAKCRWSGPDNPTTNFPGDKSTGSHGTHVAGIIGAVSGNGKGIAGLGNNHIKIASICAWRPDSGDPTTGGVTVSSFVRGMTMASQMGIKVVNTSLGGYSNDRAHPSGARGLLSDESIAALRTSVNTAYNNGITVVCSAGNERVSGYEHYPSDFPTVISVASVGRTNRRSSFSNYGSTIYISAPGESIYSTIKGGYDSKNGTSMATPMVTATVAAMLSVNPSLTVAQRKEILKTTATDIYASGFDNDSGWGVVNMGRAVQVASGLPAGMASSPYDNPDSAGSFVNRLYHYCLGRGADPSGYNGWTDSLLSGQASGAEVAYGFFFSDEFVNRNISDEVFVYLLYKVFLGRAPDAAGQQAWVDILKNGVSRLYVMNGFTGSDEFSGLCSRCGIVSGKKDVSEYRDVNYGLTAFTARLYTCTLGRSYDVNGLNAWTGAYLQGQGDLLGIATIGFLHSEEFTSKNLSNEEYVKVLYRTFLGREADQAGLDSWVAALNGGYSRDQVAAGFAYSNEFRTIMASYGL